MLAAGLLAKKAVERGLETKPWVKTSLAPGSRVVSRLPRPGRADAVPGRAGLQPGRLRLHHLHRQLRPAAGRRRRRDHRATTCRSPPCSRATATSRRASTRRCAANYLASPPLVVAYALAGTRRHRPRRREPLGTGRDGNPVFLRDVWPTADEVAAGGGRRRRQPSSTPPSTAAIFDGDERWRELPVPTGRAVRLGPRLDLRAGGHRSSSRPMPDLSDIVGRARAWRSSATRSRPTTSRRPGRSRRDSRPAAT